MSYYILHLSINPNLPFLCGIIIKLTLPLILFNLCLYIYTTLLGLLARGDLIFYLLALFALLLAIQIQSSRYLALSVESKREMSNISFVEAKLPPGFRFHPRDEELVCDYLMKKASHCDSLLMIEVDLNKCEPWDIPGES